MAVTNEFSAGETIAADEVNTNFEDLSDLLGNLTGADLHANAGILSSQLTDRYAIVTETIPLSGALQLTTSNAVAASYLPNSDTPGTEFIRKIFTLRSGRAYYLCGISVYAQNITGTRKPAIYVHRNGSLLGGSAAVILAADTAYHLRNSNPIDNPLTSLAHNDYLTVSLGVLASDGSYVSDAAVTWEGASITFTYKMELSA